MAEKGRLKIQCFKSNTYIPVDNTKIIVTPSEGSNNNANEIVLSTNSMGESETIELEAPPFAYSQEPTGQIPYSMYDIRVERDGFQPLLINRCQVFPEELALQPCNLLEAGARSFRADVINIESNVLNGDYPSKIPEEVDKPLPPPSSGVVLQKPVVPEFITVHAGSPSNNSAPNYKVLYKDYIKNVASCEIYSTWSDSTIRSNVYAIISFTLNRIYTEWYRGKGKNYDITNSTAYDHAFNYGRNLFESISAVVDDIFATYVRRFGRKQPLLTQYCDGKNVSCPEWMTQWGSKYLGDQGKTPYEILTHFYGNDIELVTAEQVKGSPKSYPGYDLTIGSTGEEVKVVQEYLNRIAQNYPLIPKSAVDGIYGAKTQEAVKVFQGVFNLPKTGIVDYATWYKISDVYVGVTRIAELRGSIPTTEKIFIPPRSFDNYYDISVPRFTYME
ncbi:peptidoglycan-binding domain-containing protein [Clostridium chauvoei]|uniref:Peptidoglycan-binding protein n=2 Tax=Clostridium chauvoei TaxID=46867 RepID=A0ABD4RGD3_9CLOT|nr:peptidoglycan-binding domain-containing protein [Clostridium chauvoei]ATD53807.1 spore cortex-lytic protein [Clostridium chauvoei]ATD58386.1 spore cortex-lytic protein [Clostridium chauvoei]MBX7280436.1 peptidoglycan-binding protein [Clostridium chauvoei]MBX7282921.1 peptidoglycan-binding protein [Clostridium chauvoei]MBX7285327.1 peptidoglycan-binding protein [Clostridium chauvoei]